MSCFAFLDCFRIDGMRMNACFNACFGDDPSPQKSRLWRALKIHRMVIFWSRRQGVCLKKTRTEKTRSKQIQSSEMRKIRQSLGRAPKSVAKPVFSQESPRKFDLMHFA